MLFTSICVHYKFMASDFAQKTLFCFERTPHCIRHIKRLSAGLYLLYDPFLLSWTLSFKKIYEEGMIRKTYAMQKKKKNNYKLIWAKFAHSYNQVHLFDHFWMSSGCILCIYFILFYFLDNSIVFHYSSSQKRENTIIIQYSEKWFICLRYRQISKQQM